MLTTLDKKDILWYNIFMDKKYNLIQNILSRLDGGTADLWQVYKLMYFIDFECYSKYRKSVTGAMYYNWQYGPMPYKNDAEYATQNIINIGQKENLWRGVGDNRVQINLENLKDSSFSLEEKDSIGVILDKYSKLSGAELVAISHEDMPWKMTKKGDFIDYDYVMWRDTEETRVEDITDKVLA
jgi:uncharacterized phage-associated protein